MNKPPLQRAVVIGAGTMGAGIAAHLANCGLHVTLIDLTLESAASGFDRALNVKPPHFMTTEVSTAVRLVGMESLEEAVQSAEWVCEAIVEKLDLKKSLFDRLSQCLLGSTLLSTNTSGLQLEMLAAGLPTHIRQRLVGVHFFNPPRYLKLIELISTPETSPEVISSFTQLLELQLGKRVVRAKDTPGFIANRFGMWSLFQAIHTAEKLGLTIEETDSITGPFIGRPRSGTFRLADVIGLDVMNDIAKNLQARCNHDPLTKALDLPDSMAALLERGWLGNKTGHGYYRKQGKDILCLDFSRLTYRPLLETKFSTIDSVRKAPLKERILAGLSANDQVGEFLREHLIPSLAYANSIRAEVSFSPIDFDRVMQWGFGWEVGPFEMIDLIGAEKCGINTKPFYEVSTMLNNDAASYSPIPAEIEFLQLKDLQKLSSKSSLDLYDGGDPVNVIAIKTKMGSITPELCSEIRETLDEGPNKSFVLTSNQPAFSVGYDLKVFLRAIESGDFESIDENLISLQRLGELLAKRSVVTAISGYGLGGGLELAISSAKIVVHSEAKLGFPEARVGLLPGGRGTTLLRMRHQNLAKDAANAATLLTSGVIFENALQAKQAGILRETDQIEFNPDRILTLAIQIAKEGFTASQPVWKPIDGPLAGIIDQQLAQKKAKGEFSAHDVLIGEAIKQVFAKSSGYEDALEKERKGFLDLCHHALTLARIKAMLENGKPLRN